MQRKTIGTTLIAAGLLAGAFLAGGALLSSSSGSSATGATGSTPPTVVTGQLPLATATVQVPATSTPTVTLTAVSPTHTPQTGGGTGTLNPPPATPVTTAPTAVPTAAPAIPVPPTAVPPTAVPPTPVPPTPVPPTPLPEIIIPTPVVLEPLNAAPTVDSVTPDDGVNGVATNANIVVTFSEEMNEASAEAAFSILPNVPGAFSWDESGSVMTFNPNANFDYNTDVQWTIASSAMDSLGKPMVKGTSGDFAVLRQSTVVLSSLASHDGDVLAPPVAGSPKVDASGVAFRAGTWMRGFLSFDLSDLPEDTTYITEATLQVLQVAHSAGAYTATTRNLYVTSVLYGSLSIDDFARPAHQFCWVVCGDASILLSSSASDVAKSTEVTAFVRKDFNLDEQGLTQFRLQFENENAGAGPSEWAEFAAGESGFIGPKLTVTVIHK